MRSLSARPFVWIRETLRIVGDEPIESWLFATEQLSLFPGTQEDDLVHEISFTCGHHHWVLDAAVERVDRLRGTKLAVNTNIKLAVPDQQNDGEVVEEREIAIARRNLFLK